MKISMVEVGYFLNRPSRSWLSEKVMRWGGRGSLTGLFKAWIRKIKAGKVKKTYRFETLSSPGAIMVSPPMILSASKPEKCTEQWEIEMFAKTLSFPDPPFPYPSLSYITVIFKGTKVQMCMCYNIIPHCFLFDLYRNTGLYLKITKELWLFW